MTDSSGSTATDVRLLVISGTETAAEELAERLTTRGTLVVDSVGRDAILDEIEDRRIDCIVEDHSRAENDGIDVDGRERVLERRDLLYVPLVEFAEWVHFGTHTTRENTVPLPKPPPDGLEALGDCIRAIVDGRRNGPGPERLQMLLWDLADDLMDAPTQQAIVERVCGRLADSDRFDGAWIIDRQPDPTIRATAGIEPDRVEELHAAFEPDPPWVRAVNERTGHVHPRTGAEPGTDEGRRLDGALISIPLLYRGILYGVLNVASDRPHSPNEATNTSEALDTFGRIVGQALATAEMQAQGETVQQAIEQADPAIAILDESGTIEYVNTAFESVYGYAKSEAVGEPASLLVPATVDLASLLDEVREDAPWRQEIVKHDREGRRFHADLSVAAVSVEGGTRQKYVAVASDITALKEREQRLEVLNRVLRHNLRNDMTAVAGYADLLAEDPVEYREYADRIGKIAEELVAIGEKAREIEEVVATSQGEQVAPLSTVVSRVIEDIRTEYPGCTVEVTIPDEEVHVDEPVLTLVLREVVRNGVEHNDSRTPRITIEATVRERTENPVEIRLTDNGPGIPDHELVPVREGTETALEHGSSLGLWLIRWGVTRLNGHVEFAEGEPRGTVVRIRLPARR